MASLSDTVKQYIGIKEQRILLFIGFYFTVGLILYAYVFEISILVILLILAWYVHDLINSYTAEGVDPAGKYVFITGCDSGFGLASAKALRELGFIVIAGCYDENSAGAQELKARSWVDKVEIVNLDVASELSVEVAAKEVREICQDQGLWALINNAGINCMGPSELVSMVMYHRVAEVNLFGTIRVTKACLPLIRQTKGRIINVTSERGFNPHKNNSSYCVTKFGVEAYSACLRGEMANFGVKVVTVAPGQFAAATGIVDSKMNDVIRERLLCEHSKLSIEDQNNTYPKEDIEKFCDDIDHASDVSFSSRSPDAVVKAYVDAVCNKRPKSCYLIHANGRFGLEPNIVMARIRPLLPLPVVGYVEKFLFMVLT